MSTTTQFFITAWTILDSLPTVYSLVAGMSVGILLIACILRKEFRWFRNVRRPIMIFSPKGSTTLDMKMETKILRDTKFFKIPEDPSDNFQDCHNIANHSLVIVGYEPGMAGFKDILNAVKSVKIPIVVYTKQPLAETDRNLLNSYPWHSVCNFPLKLLSDTFTILSTFPNKKRI
ncbi:MAG: hypothetical protein PHW95_03220 [Patescibacteria group bacterium]|nr:hypothetical protein [Patescibacteria group bacterium]